MSSEENYPHDNNDADEAAPRIDAPEADEAESGVEMPAEHPEEEPPQNADTDADVVQPDNLGDAEAADAEEQQPVEEPAEEPTEELAEALRETEQDQDEVDKAVPEVAQGEASDEVAAAEAAAAAAALDDATVELAAPEDVDNLQLETVQEPINDGAQDVAEDVREAGDVAADVAADVAVPEAPADSYRSSLDSSIDAAGARHASQEQHQRHLQAQQQDDQTELVVLDPDHPLMARFQTALQKMLTKQLERINLEYKENTEQHRMKNEEHIGLGNELYTIQQELAKQQSSLESLKDKFNVRVEQRERGEREVEAMRHRFKTEHAKLTAETKRADELRREQDTLALRLFFVAQAQQDVRGDIAVMQRAAEKTGQDVRHQQTEKHVQDLLINYLVERVDRLREQIGVYEAQLSAQNEERQQAADVLSEAQTELSAIRVEKSRLVAQWKSALIGLQRRNEAYGTLGHAMQTQRDQLATLHSELEGYRKSIGVEQEANEKLTLVHNKSQAEQATVRKQQSALDNRQDAVKQRYAMCSRMLAESGEALAGVTRDAEVRRGELEQLRRVGVQRTRRLVDLENELVAGTRDRTAMGKARRYVERLTESVREKRRQLEQQCALVENTLAEAALRMARVAAETGQLRKQYDEVELEIGEQNTLISRLEEEVGRSNILVERKQGVVDQLNKRLEAMIGQAGGEEMGPLEITLKHLGRNVTAVLDEIGGSEQQWLREQAELVALVDAREVLSGQVGRHRKQTRILSGKKARLEAGIQAEHVELAGLRRQLAQLRRQMGRLNGRLFEQRRSGEEKCAQNELVEQDFVRALRGDELESVQLRARGEQLRVDKERLLNELVEAERQIMQWEKKIQLAQETRAAVDTEIGQGEMKLMRAEIHRMEIRLAQLLRQQEILVHEMERSVSRRDVIATRGEAVQKLAGGGGGGGAGGIGTSASSKLAVTQSSVTRQIDELKRKIKASTQTIRQFDAQIEQAGGERERLAVEIDEKKRGTDEQQAELDRLTGLVERAEQNSYANMIELQQRQQVSKSLQEVKDNRYTWLIRATPSQSDSANSRRDEERRKQKQHTMALLTVLDRTSNEFPQMLRELAPLRNILQARIAQFSDASAT